MGKLDSKNKFNGGVELEEDYGVNLYSTFYRKYDPQIGRFSGVDCQSEASIGMSVYQFAGNNPVMLNDPLGNKMTAGLWDRGNGYYDFQGDNLFNLQILYQVLLWMQAMVVEVVTLLEVEQAITLLFGIRC